MVIRTYRGTIIASLAICALFTHNYAAAASIADIPSSFTFDKTLRPNFSYDPDVKYLQLVLNNDNQTTVSLIGPGSNNNPTTYYGNKTKDAVNRFQMLYKDEILTPAGLTAPTGIVGANTRLKLNQILRDIRSGQLPINTQSNPSDSSGEYVDTLDATASTTSDESTASSSATQSSSTTPSTGTTNASNSSGTFSNPSNTTSSSNNTTGGNTTAQNTSASTNGNTSNSSSGSSNSGAAAAVGAAAVGVGATSLTSSGSSASTGSTGGSGTQYFGGRISNVTYCTCSASVMIDVQDKLRGYVSVIYMPGVSRLYANYNVFTPGPNVIGGYTPGGVCLIYSGTQCNSQGAPMGTINTIHGVGTSLQ